MPPLSCLIDLGGCLMVSAGRGGPGRRSQFAQIRMRKKVWVERPGLGFHCLSKHVFAQRKTNGDDPRCSGRMAVGAQISSMESAGTRPLFLPLLSFRNISPSSNFPTQI